MQLDGSQRSGNLDGATSLGEDDDASGSTMQAMVRRLEPAMPRIERRRADQVGGALNQADDA
jgi:hypothetical protein